MSHYIHLYPFNCVIDESKEIVAIGHNKLLAAFGRQESLTNPKGHSYILVADLNGQQRFRTSKPTAAEGIYG